MKSKHFKKPGYIVVAVIVGVLLTVNMIVASRYEPTEGDNTMESLTFLRNMEPKLCPTCPECKNWDMWNYTVDTGLGSCTLAASPHADWNVAFAYPGGPDLGKISFWICDLMMFKNTGGFTSPIAGSYEEGDCYNIKQRDCTVVEEDDYSY